MGFCLFLLCLPASPHQASLVAFWSHPAILGRTEAPRGAETLEKGLSHEVLQLSCFHLVLRVQLPILGASQWGFLPTANAPAQCPDLLFHPSEASRSLPLAPLPFQWPAPTSIQLPAYGGM